jgi:hypothetical protein
MFRSSVQLSEQVQAAKGERHDTGQRAGRPEGSVARRSAAGLDPLAAQRPPSGRYPASLTAKPNYYRYFLDLSIETA